MSRRLWSQCLSAAMAGIGALTLMVAATGVAVEEIPPSWSYGVLGSSVGAPIATIDVDDDGRDEIIVKTWNGGVQGLAVVGWKAGAEAPEVVLTGPPVFGSIYDATAWRAGDSWFTATLLADGQLLVHRLPGFDQVASATIDFIAYDLVAGDLLGSGTPQVVASSTSQSVVLDSADLSVLVDIPFGGTRNRIGNVDSDPALELVLSVGTILDIRDLTPVVEWTLPVGYISNLVVADLDDDGIDEVAVFAGTVQVFDVGEVVPWWTSPYSVDGLAAVDVTRDGVPELLLSSSYSIRAIDPSADTEVWAHRYDSSCRPRSSPSAPDFDGDGFGELIWSGNYGEQLCAADAWTGELLWESGGYAGPFIAIEAGDVDSDGEPEIVVATNDERLLVFEMGEAQPRFKQHLSIIAPGFSTVSEPRAVTIGDADRDGWPEVVVVADDSYSGAVLLIDGATLEIERWSAWRELDVLSAVDIADLDGDGWPELVVGQGHDTSAFNQSTLVAVIEGATGELEWQSEPVGSAVSGAEQLIVGNVDNDAELEIVVTEYSRYHDDTSWGRLYVIDGSSGFVRTAPNDDLNGLALIDLDGDGVSEILSGTSNGKLVVFEGIGLVRELWRWPVSDDPVAGVLTYVEPGGRQVAVVATGHRLIAIDLADGSKIWRTPILGGDAGAFDGLALIPAASPDALPKILVGTAATLHVIDPGSTQIFSDGFEHGDTSAWSNRIDQAP